MTLRASPLLRRAAAAVALAVLAGCTSGDRVTLQDNVRADITSRIAGLLGLGGEGAAPAPAVTRAQLEAAGGALIWVEPQLAERAAPFIAVSKAGDRVTYIDAGDVSVTLLGGQLAASSGLAFDLDGYVSDPAQDPTVRPRPPADWPAQVTRIYRHLDAFGDPVRRAAACRPRVVGPTTIVIFERAHDVVEIEEPCRTRDVDFVNRWWVDAASGYVWRSEQWIGPRAGVLRMEQVVPLNL